MGDNVETKARKETKGTKEKKKNQVYKEGKEKVKKIWRSEKK